MNETPEQVKAWNDGFEKGRTEYLDNDKKVRAEMLVDLYEARAQVIPQVTAHRQMHSVEEVFQYQWLNVIFAKITDKYKIKNEDIKEAIKNRNVEKDNFEENLAILKDNLQLGSKEMFIKSNP